MDCYPNTLPFDLLPIDDKLRRLSEGEARKKRWAAGKAEVAERLRAARANPYNVRKTRERSRLDFAQRARRLLAVRAGPGAPTATTAELREMWKRQGGRCALTGLQITGTPHLDHIVAAAKGGAHTIENLQWTHPIANIAKNSHSVDEFHTWLLAAAESLKAKLALEKLF